MMRICACLSLLSCALLLPGAEWYRLPVTVSGSQVDAVADAAGTIHLVAKEYVAVDQHDVVVHRERPDDEDLDGRQGGLDFPPAIAIGDDGVVHTLTRHGGGWRTGHELRYRRRLGDGTWSAVVVVGEPEPRNYTVALTALDDGTVIAAHGSLKDQDNVWGPLVFWQLEPTAATELGRVESWWRGDNDCRFRSTGESIRFVAGRNDPNGKVRIAGAEGSTNLVQQLTDSVQVHRSGGGRRGMPSVALAADGTTHLTYGANGDQSVHYRRYTADFQPIGEDDQQLFADLGDWHLALGLSEVAVSPDGDQVLVVALHTDGSKSAKECTVEWRLSTDGGDNWGPVQTIPGLTTHAGEGRRRPRLVWSPTGFVLAISDTSGAEGISLFRLGEEAPARERIIRMRTPAGATWTCTPAGTITQEDGATVIRELEARSQHRLSAELGLNG